MTRRKLALLGQTLIGLKPAHGGKIFLENRETRIPSPMVAVKHGIDYVSED